MNETKKLERRQEMKKLVLLIICGLVMVMQLAPVASAAVMLQVRADQGVLDATGGSISDGEEVGTWEDQSSGPHKIGIRCLYFLLFDFIRISSINLMLHEEHCKRIDQTSPHCLGNRTPGAD